MDGLEQDRGDLVARSVGALLVAEGGLLAASRFFTLVYTVADQVDRADSQILPKTTYVPFLISSILLVTILIGAGAQLRLSPAGAWREAGSVRRVDLILAGTLNLALAVWVGVELMSSRPLGAGAVVAGVLAILVALAVVAGLVRDAAGRARPTVSR